MRRSRRTFRRVTRRRLVIGGAAAGCALMVSVCSGLALGRFTTAGMNRYSARMFPVRAAGEQYRMIYDASDDIFASPGRSAPTGGRIERVREPYLPATELSAGARTY